MDSAQVFSEKLGACVNAGCQLLYPSLNEKSWDDLQAVFYNVTKPYQFDRNGTIQLNTNLFSSGL